MRNIKLVLEYDGTDFVGWQTQAQGRTVQDTLQEALLRLAQESPVLVGAGRTDSGVHALGQVVNFKLEKAFRMANLTRGLNRFLPADVRVRDAAEVDNDFHARHDATGRSYRYVIASHQTAVDRRHSWHCKYALDLDRIRNASEFLLGTHCYEAFSKLVEKEKHYLCHITRVVWSEFEERLVFEISANRFLHKMVRIIVGTLVEVGRGKIAPEQVETILASRNRRLAGPAIPARGLFLVKVAYQLRGLVKAV